MGLFDFLTGGGQSAAPAPAAPAAPPTPTAMPSYDDYLRMLTNAAALREKAYGGNNTWAWLTGQGRDAAIAGAQANAPMAYFKLLQEQALAKGGQLDTGQTAMFLDRAGIHSDPTTGVISQGGSAPPAPPAATPPSPSPQITGLPGNVPPALPAAIFGQESGNSDAAPTSANGAVGPAQLMPGTFAQYAKPGENIHNPADNRAVAQRVLADLTAKTGGDPARIAVGYFSGPGNIAPPGSPTPWVRDVADANGKPVSSYVQDIMGRLQGANAAPSANAAPQAGNPVADQTAMFTRFANSMTGLPKFLQAQQDYAKLGQMGAPAGTVRTADGVVRDGVTGQPINGTGQQYAAAGEGMKSEAQQGPQRATDLFRAQNDARYKTINGFDTTTGLPKTATEFDVATNAAPNFAPGANPYFAGQQEEVKKAQDVATNAVQGLQIATQVANAANGIYTGKGAETTQDIRKWGQALASLTGSTVPPEILNSTSKYEQLKFAAQELVGIASHQISPRIAQNIYQQIATIKPGDATSMQGLRDIITKELMPALMQGQATPAALQSYYRAHPLANDASSHVMQTMPLEQFNVKTDLHKVEPGDYYIDPGSGNIRQRPAR